MNNATLLSILSFGQFSVFFLEMWHILSGHIALRWSAGGWVYRFL